MRGYGFTVSRVERVQKARCAARDPNLTIAFLSWTGHVLKNHVESRDSSRQLEQTPATHASAVPIPEPNPISNVPGTTEPGAAARSPACPDVFPGNHSGSSRTDIVGRNHPNVYATIHYSKSSADKCTWPVAITSGCGTSEEGSHARRLHASIRRLRTLGECLFPHV